MKAQERIFKKVGCGDVGWIYMAPGNIHGVGTVNDRALQLSFPLISFVTRAAKLNPKLYISEITEISMPHLHPHPLKKTLGWLSNEDNFCEFIQHHVPKLHANKLRSAVCLRSSLTITFVLPYQSF